VGARLGPSSRSLNPPGLRNSLDHSKEADAQPMGARDLLRNAGERGIALAHIDEAALRDSHGIRPTSPFPHQPNSRLDLRSGVNGYPTLSSSSAAKVVSSVLWL